MVTPEYNEMVTEYSARTNMVLRQIREEDAVISYLQDQLAQRKREKGRLNRVLDVMHNIDYHSCENVEQLSSEIGRLVKLPVGEWREFKVERKERIKKMAEENKHKRLL